MRSEYFTICGGNKTRLLWECTHAEMQQNAVTFSKDVEQFGFVSGDTVPRLTMMGDELCIDGILALATWIDSQRGVLCASGVRNEIQFEKTDAGTKIVFELPYTIENDVVLFEGIGFLCTQNMHEWTKKECNEFAQKYEVPAFGIIRYTKNKIDPWVYVVQTDTFVHETACGSGSIAMHLITGFCDILQPTGEIISITHEKDMFSVTAQVQSNSI